MFKCLLTPLGAKPHPRSCGWYNDYLDMFQIYLAKKDKCAAIKVLHCGRSFFFSWWLDDINFLLCIWGV